MLLSSHNVLRRNIILALAHIYPKSISGVQLAKLIGYSGQSKTLYRGVLKHLSEDQLILVDQLTPRMYAIRINHEHPLMKSLIELCKKYGQDLRKIYLDALGAEFNEKHN